MSIHRSALIGLAASVALAGATGCATKNYVRNQTAPLIEHTDQLNAKTAENNRKMNEVNNRAQAGIKQAQVSADSAGKNAQDASKAAGDAQTVADNAVHRADSLAGVVSGLDNYQPITTISVTFGFDKSVLTKEDLDQLDAFAAKLGSVKSYILEVTGGTDSTGSAQYNYDLSQRRADAGVQYLGSRYGIAPHRFYLIGIGKDKEVAPNTSADGRKQNRRVEVRLLSNRTDEAGQTASTSRDSN